MKGIQERSQGYTLKIMECILRDICKTLGVPELLTIFGQSRMSVLDHSIHSPHLCGFSVFHTLQSRNSLVHRQVSDANLNCRLL